MNNFIITTDTTCDLPLEYVKENSLYILPLYYNFNDQIYGDGVNDHSPKEFYNIMREGAIPTTMAVNPDNARTVFENLLKEGNDVLHIAFSSGLSGSCSVATTVARELAEEYPDNKIVVVDSLCASLGEGLLVSKAVNMKKAGKTYDEILAWLEENKLNICHMFTVDDLNHLHRGGRVSKTTAIIGTLINVKPVLRVDDEGHLVPLTKARGRKKSLSALVEQMESRVAGFDNDSVFISHGDSLEDAEYVATLIRERFGIQNILINYVSPTIGAHAGPGTIALFFMGSPR